MHRLRWPGQHADSGGLNVRLFEGCQNIGVDAYGATELQVGQPAAVHGVANEPLRHPEVLRSFSYGQFLAHG
jgi:hypothetical protein